MESVPKWNDLERVFGRSEMERWRTYSTGFEMLSLYLGMFSLLSNKFHHWTHSWSSADKSLNHFQRNSTSSIEWCAPIHCNSNPYQNNHFLKWNLTYLEYSEKNKGGLRNPPKRFCRFLKDSKCVQSLKNFDGTFWRFCILLNRRTISYRTFFKVLYSKKRFGEKIRNVEGSVQDH